MHWIPSDWPICIFFAIPVIALVVRWLRKTDGDLSEVRLSMREIEGEHCGPLCPFAYGLECQLYGDSELLPEDMRRTERCQSM